DYYCYSGNDNSGVF
nr:immunoglobulin light chain junction region [Macaca mulatta]MOW29271.1 immunoglobulin light chain junction region [Macaca mulatta]MOW30341.1 immunoglobulin light chain junction region [Macaca mulatta]